MSKAEILYVKGMNISESDRDLEEVEDIWDDTKLNEAYDKALKMANAEVARRVAMSTNTQPHNDSSKTTTSKGTTVKSSHRKDQKTQWKAGMPCRAVYADDGHEYEAFLLRMINDKECIVRFLGYDNSEIVLINSLKPTLGKKERTRQIEEALVDKTDDGGSSDTFHIEKIEHSDIEHSVASSGNYPKKRSGKKEKQKQKQKLLNTFALPDMPMPNLAQLRNFESMDMPIPPPPPLSLHHGANDTEEQAVSSMLLSWYMSGYYTGLYQGMKRAKENQRH